jgi:methyl-accepting chemotaxis protein
MNIKTKILIPSLVAVLMMLVLGVVSFLGLRSTQQALSDFSSSSMQHITILNEGRGELLDTNVSAYRLFASMAQFDEARVKKDTEIILTHADNAIRLIKSLSERVDIDEEEKKKLAAFDEPLIKYRKNVAQAIDMAQSDLNSGTGMMRGADRRFIEIDGKLQEMLGSQKKGIEETVASSLSHSSSIISLEIGVFVVGVAGALAIALILGGKIVAPMLDAVQAATSIAGGNLNNAIHTGGQDETGELLRALSAMQDSLRQLIGQISSNVRITASACSEMSGAQRRIQHSVDAQHDATSAVASAAEEMSASIVNIQGNANQSFASSQASDELATQGVAIIQSAFDEIRRIADTVNQAASVVERVGQQSNEISTIVRVIREVADQTNLLALNAAIEAARAGEAGRGFAVVADEVRKLAEKTASSAEEITRMIGGIQDSSDKAVQNIHHAVTQAETTANYAENARESIESIHASALKSEGFARDITLAIAEQSTASTLISQKIEGIARMSEESAQSVTQSVQIMQTLEEESRVLQAAVARFSV